MLSPHIIVLCFFHTRPYLCTSTSNCIFWCCHVTPINFPLILVISAFLGYNLSLQISTQLFCIELLSLSAKFDYTTLIRMVTIINANLFKFKLTYPSKQKPKDIYWRCSFWCLQNKHFRVNICQRYWHRITSSHRSVCNTLKAESICNWFSTFSSSASVS